MKSAAAVFAITILTANAVFGQVHIKDTISIVPANAKKVLGGVNNHTLRFEYDWCGAVAPGCEAGFEGCWPCWFPPPTTFYSSSGPAVVTISPAKAGHYGFHGDIDMWCIEWAFASWSWELTFDDSLVSSGSGNGYLEGICSYAPDPSYVETGFTTPYYSTIDFSLSTHQFGWGNSTGMNLNADYDCDNPIALYTTDQVTLTIVSGSQYVSFHETNPDTKMGSVVTTTIDDAGQYSLVADGDTARSNDCWVKVQAECDGVIKTDTTQILPSVDHFYVYTNPDTISDSASTTMYVQAQDKSNENMDYDGNVQITASPSGYGHLGNSIPCVIVGPKGNSGKGITMSALPKSRISGKKLQTVNSTGEKSVAAGDSVLEVSYWTANYGQVFYTADGAAPDSNMTINFTVTAVDQTSVTGQGYVVIKGNGPKLEVVYPTDELKASKDITEDPVMPDIVPKARLENYKGGTVNFQWNLRVQWEGPDGRQFDDPFPGNTTAKNSQESKWTIDWNKMIRGGDELTLDVTATAGGKVYDKTVNHPFIITGKNPSKDQVKAGLTLEQQVIVYLESKSKWCQFGKDGFPSFGGPHGYGLMQLDPISDNEQAWDWKANIAEGQSRFEKKKTSASNHPANVRRKGGAYRYATDYTQQQFLTDAFQLYNGFHYWTWTPADPSRGGGTWVKDPNLGKPKAEGGYGRDYGGLAIQVYNNVVNGNPPDGW